MRNILITLMNWLARPYPSLNIVVLSIFNSLIFLTGIALAYLDFITEVFEVLHAPKLRIALRVGCLLFFSFYCTLGCFCRILIQCWPEELSSEFNTH